MEIRDMIKATGRTYQEIADEAGVNVSFIGLIATGRRRVGIDTIRGVARALGVHPRDLRPDIAEIFEQ